MSAVPEDWRQGASSRCGRRFDVRHWGATTGWQSRRYATVPVEFGLDAVLMAFAGPSLRKDGVYDDVQRTEETVA